jgi:hypothetical protein
MYKKILLLLAISVCLSAVVSCSKDEAPVSTGGKLGQVTTDRTRYGVGQLVNLSCTVADGENIADTRYSFVLPSGVEDNVTIANGVATYSFTPEEAGDITVKFKQQSLGNDAQDYIVESPLTLAVVECDYYNSFWGDDVAECLRNNPALIVMPGLDSDYSIEGTGFKYGIGSSTSTFNNYYEVHYFFSNGKLDEGYVYVEPVTGLSKFYHLYVSFYLSRLYTEDVTYSYTLANGYTPSAELSAILAKVVTGNLTDFVDATKLSTVNDAVATGKINLLYEGKIRKTKVRLLVSSRGNSVYFEQI